MASTLGALASVRWAKASERHLVDSGGRHAMCTGGQTDWRREMMFDFPLAPKTGRRERERESSPAAKMIAAPATSNRAVIGAPGWPSCSSNKRARLAAARATSCLSS
jgi:hypothetical protein